MPPSHFQQPHPLIFIAFIQQILSIDAYYMHGTLLHTSLYFDYKWGLEKDRSRNLACMVLNYLVRIGNSLSLKELKIGLYLPYRNSGKKGTIGCKILVWFVEKKILNVN